MGSDARQLGGNCRPIGMYWEPMAGFMALDFGHLPRTGISSGTLCSFQVWDYLPSYYHYLVTLGFVIFMVMIT